MPGRTRDDMLAALRQSSTRRTAELDRLLDWQDRGEAKASLARLDVLDQHIDGLLAALFTLESREAT